MTETMTAFFGLITSALTAVLGWIGAVADAIFTAEGGLFILAGMLAIGIAISGVMLGVKVIKGFTWGA